ncbi:MAG: hypothetical protein SGI92_15415 [Bryobacteraceae bacterium]|nr:hypothetical protein [Bryobacteraceae bacterium]
MVAFRKLYPVLAVAALSVASAFGQGVSTPLVCQANSGVPPVVRAEGLTELTGDLVINCTGGNPAAAIMTNIQVFLNTNVTSRLGGGDTYDALLMIDEPGAARTDVNGAATAGVTPFCPTAAGAAACNPAVVGQTYQQGTQTVYRGTKPLVSVQNSLVWAGVTIVPPGSNRTRTIRITNVRANASAIGATTSGLPNQIIAFISSFPQGTLPIDNPQQTVGYVQQGLLFDTRNCGNTGGRGGSVNGFQCQSRNQDRFNTPTGGGLPSNGATNDTVVGLRFREGFQTAFKVRIATAAGQAASLPGQVFNSESGFVNPGTDVAGQPAAGVADAGTRLMARFNNVPSNVRIFVSVASVMPTSSVGSAAVLVTTDPNGATPNNPNPTAPAPGAPPGVVTVNCSGVTLVPSGANAVEVPLTAGTGQAVWEVTAADQSNLETLIFHAAYAYVANANAGQPGIGAATVMGTFAPVYTASNAGQSDFGTPSIPRFVAGTASAQSFFSISSCVTNLLFPFVTNQAGFDTGIAIANTSQDPFSSSNQNAGTCRLNYYGTLPNNAPLTTTSETTDRDVAAGATLTMVLSTGGGFGLKGNPNMQGYIIAQCNFRFAHGFAFITDGPIGQARVAEGYLAIVLDGIDTIRGNVNGEEQGH